MSLPSLPPRPPDSHKGSFGSVSILGGCALPHARMIGAPALAALAALRAGCGLARLVMPEPILNAGLTIAPGATGRAIPVLPSGGIIPHEAAAVVDAVVASSTCLAIGPGLGGGAAGEDGARAVTLRAIQQEDIPVVVDADAINALAQTPQISLDFRAAAVLTPHPGEFKRLTAGLGLPNHLGIDASRERAAEQLAQRLGCIVVLKGAGTVVSDGARTWVNSSGHPCLATGGTGDVLTGLLASIIAQFVPPPPPSGIPSAIRDKLPRPPAKLLDLFEAARLAVHIHGLAGERWAQQHQASGGLLATDLPGLLPPLIESMREAAPQRS